MRSKCKATPSFVTAVELTSRPIGISLDRGAVGWRAGGLEGRQGPVVTPQTIGPSSDREVLADDVNLQTSKHCPTPGNGFFAKGITTLRPATRTAPTCSPDTRYSTLHFSTSHDPSKRNRPLVAKAQATLPDPASSQNDLVIIASPEDCPRCLPPV